MWQWEITKGHAYFSPLQVRHRVLLVRKFLVQVPTAVCLSAFSPLRSMINHMFLLQLYVMME